VHTLKARDDSTPFPHFGPRTFPCEHSNDT